MSPPRSQRWTYRLAAEFGHRDITDDVARFVVESGVRTGAVVVSLVGSTGIVTTIEYEQGALQDFRRALDQIAPPTVDYAHNAAYGDGNGFSHVRSALVGPSVSLPVVEGKLVVGTWQKVAVFNLDNRPREREVVAVVVGL
ncbi:MAG TPA: secondary thiamine-phosphate synthase enzyme YjbQ [Gemmatimonadales bacterium]|nr:secondary thiamine-phosphate synthase enzyme YjbQ [Gemmatimonadales bacterium]